MTDARQNEKLKKYALKNPKDLPQYREGFYAVKCRVTQDKESGKER